MDPTDYSLLAALIFVLVALAVSSIARAVSASMGRMSSLAIGVMLPYLLPNYSV
jgi:hypothetical protein